MREGFFPQGCVLCGKTPDPFFGLCSDCHESLAIPEADRGRCSICGQPLISEQETCLICRDGPEKSFNRLISLFPYMGRYKKVLREYKFKKRLCLGNFFAEKILLGLDILLSAECAPDICLVPVPARPGKIKHKGWDQVEYLAKLLHANHSMPVRRCLKRLPSESQKELDRKNRLQNLKGRIIINNRDSHIPGKNAVPKTAVLFDDVYTTGATMEACALALKSWGTERVFGICLCYD